MLQLAVLSLLLLGHLCLGARFKMSGVTVTTATTVASPYDIVSFTSVVFSATQVRVDIGSMMGGSGLPLQVLFCSCTIAKGAVVYITGGSAASSRTLKIIATGLTIKTGGSLVLSGTMPQASVISIPSPIIDLTVGTVTLYTSIVSFASQADISAGSYRMGIVLSGLQLTQKSSLAIESPSFYGGNGIPLYIDNTLTISSTSIILLKSWYTETSRGIVSPASITVTGNSVMELNDIYFQYSCTTSSGCFNFFGSFTVSSNSVLIMYKLSADCVSNLLTLSNLNLVSGSYWMLLGNVLTITSSNVLTGTCTIDSTSNAVMANNLFSLNPFNFVFSGTTSRSIGQCNSAGGTAWKVTTDYGSIQLGTAFVCSTCNDQSVACFAPFTSSYDSSSCTCTCTSQGTGARCLPVSTPVAKANCVQTKSSSLSPTTTIAWSNSGLLSKSASTTLSAASQSQQLSVDTTLSRTQSSTTTTSPTVTITQQLSQTESLSQSATNSSSTTFTVSASQTSSLSFSRAYDSVSDSSTRGHSDSSTQSSSLSREVSSSSTDSPTPSETPSPTDSGSPSDSTSLSLSDSLSRSVSNEQSQSLSGTDGVSTSASKSESLSLTKTISDSSSISESNGATMTLSDTASTSLTSASVSNSRSPGPSVTKPPTRTISWIPTESLSTSPSRSSTNTVSQSGTATVSVTPSASGTNTPSRTNSLSETWSWCFWYDPVLVPVFPTQLQLNSASNFSMRIDYYSFTRNGCQFSLPNLGQWHLVRFDFSGVTSNVSASSRGVTVNFTVATPRFLYDPELTRSVSIRVEFRCAQLSRFESYTIEIPAAYAVLSYKAVEPMLFVATSAASGFGALSPSSGYFAAASASISILILCQEPANVKQYALFPVDGIVPTSAEQNRFAALLVNMIIVVIGVMALTTLLLTVVTLINSRSVLSKDDYEYLVPKRSQHSLPFESCVGTPQRFFLEWRRTKVMTGFPMIFLHPMMVVTTPLTAGASLSLVIDTTVSTAAVAVGAIALVAHAGYIAFLLSATRALYLHLFDGFLWFEPIPLWLWDEALGSELRRRLNIYLVKPKVKRRKKRKQRHEALGLSVDLFAAAEARKESQVEANEVKKPKSKVATTLLEVFRGLRIAWYAPFQFVVLLLFGLASGVPPYLGESCDEHLWVVLLVAVVHVAVLFRYHPHISQSDHWVAVTFSMLVVAVVGFNAVSTRSRSLQSAMTEATAALLMAMTVVPVALLVLQIFQNRRCFTAILPALLRRVDIPTAVLRGAEFVAPSAPPTISLDSSASIPSPTHSALPQSSDNSDFSTSDSDSARDVEIALHAASEPTSLSEIPLQEIQGDDVLGYYVREPRVEFEGQPITNLLHRGEGSMVRGRTSHIVVKDNVQELFHMVNTTRSIDDDDDDSKFL